MPPQRSWTDELTLRCLKLVASIACLELQPFWFCSPIFGSAPSICLIYNLRSSSTWSLLAVSVSSKSLCTHRHNSRLYGAAVRSVSLAQQNSPSSLSHTRHSTSCISYSRLCNRGACLLGQTLRQYWVAPIYSVAPINWA